MEPMKESVRIRIQYYGGLLARILFGHTVRGASKVPRYGGLIIACNHISEMDPPVLGFSIPRNFAIMAKVELFKHRFGDFFLRKLNAFPVNRAGIDTKALRTAIDILKGGEAVVIFPEGTRSHDGHLLPPKAGISLIASASGAPVLPAFIWGTDHAVKALTRKGKPFSVSFGRLISSRKLMEIKKKEGKAAVAKTILAAIAETGRQTGLYSK
ncbi:MAG: 1-acyl-sn-glycerol-3-phosphate acyltransferase [Candidatus Aegiribacteria sp.]|nr:1-acyl-sn-glycerol-3-phosphate acyltransferase [Candidatus Aegiribacteria sp.]